MQLIQCAALLSTACVLVSSCEGSAPPIHEPPIHEPAQPNDLPATATTPEGCPPEVLVRALHAASFHFQHGPIEEGHHHLARARQLARELGPFELGGSLARLSSIFERIGDEPDWARSETEHLRLFFSSWRCLPDAMHDRFHEALPSIKTRQQWQL